MKRYRTQGGGGTHCGQLQQHWSQNKQRLLTMPALVSMAHRPWDVVVCSRNVCERNAGAANGNTSHKTTLIRCLSSYLAKGVRRVLMDLVVVVVVGLAVLAMVGGAGTTAKFSASRSIRS